MKNKFKISYLLISLTIFFASFFSYGQNNSEVQLKLDEIDKNLRIASDTFYECTFQKAVNEIKETGYILGLNRMYPNSIQSKTEINLPLIVNKFFSGTKCSQNFNYEFSKYFNTILNANRARELYHKLVLERFLKDIMISFLDLYDNNIIDSADIAFLSSTNKNSYSNDASYVYMTIEFSAINNLDTFVNEFVQSYLNFSKLDYLSNFLCHDLKMPKIFLSQKVR